MTRAHVFATAARQLEIRRYRAALDVIVQSDITRTAPSRKSREALSQAVQTYDRPTGALAMAVMRGHRSSGY